MCGAAHAKRSISFFLAAFIALPKERRKCAWIEMCVREYYTIHPRPRCGEFAQQVYVNILCGKPQVDTSKLYGRALFHDFSFIAPGIPLNPMKPCWVNVLPCLALPSPALPYLALPRQSPFKVKIRTPSPVYS